MANEIKLKVNKKNADRQHFMVSFDRPGRIEVSVTKSGRVIAHVYEGAEVSMEQEPLGAFDGTMPDKDITDWTA